MYIVFEPLNFHATLVSTELIWITLYVSHKAKEPEDLRLLELQKSQRQLHLILKYFLNITVREIYENLLF